MVHLLLITMALFLLWEFFRIGLSIYVYFYVNAEDSETHQLNAKAAQQTRLRIILISIAFGVLYIALPTFNALSSGS